MEIYSFSPSDININQQIAIVGGFIGSYLATRYINKGGHLIDYLIFLSLVSAGNFLYMAWAFHVQPEPLNAYVSVFKFIDALVALAFAVAAGHFTKSVFFSCEKNGQFYGYFISIIFGIKFLMPLVGSHYVESAQSVLMLMIAGAVASLIVAFILVGSRVRLDKYHHYFKRHMPKPDGETSVKAGVKSYVLEAEGRINRLSFIIYTGFVGWWRPFYDMYLPLILVSTFAFTIIESSIIMSFLFIGQALQFLTAKYSDKLELWVQSGTFTAFKVLLISVLAFSETVQGNLYMAAGIMLLLGVARSLHGAYTYKKINSLVDSKNNLQNLNFIYVSYGELAHLLGYAVAGAIFMATGELSSLLYFALGIAMVVSVYPVIERKVMK